ncbi:transcriptional regulator [Burkholderia sp. WAC0059]|uniref:LysR family transcriptional regulator n=1 Tax=Burkholderia sp. WAC0059 TaxID=2066022 RepID=UPI000C7F27A2|nr:LysR family transcriptional regulator [Burkholderia sp. WAC0059]PLZ02958.1 transcriptional regulator [Burkholderia sp. WAC0059]
MDTTKVLGIFLSVARASSFSQAALDTGLTTPAVSRAVAQLEAHLGIRLLHRTTRRVSLTDEGSRLFELAEAGLRLLDEAMDKTIYAKQQLGGTIRITAPRSLGLQLVVPLIAEFQALHPDVQFEAALDDHFTDLVAQKIDIGFRAGSEPERSVIARSLSPMELIICASPDYLARHGAPASVEDLLAHRCTGFRHPNTGRPMPWELQVGGEFVYQPIPAVATFNDVETEICAVRAGIGVGQLPTYMVTGDLRDGTLVQLLPELSTHRLGIFMYYAQRERIPVRVRQFIDFVMTSRSVERLRNASAPPPGSVPPRPAALREPIAGR